MTQVRAGAAQPPSGAVPMTRMGKAIARRMVAAKTEIPEFTSEIEIDVTKIRELRDSLKRAGDPAPSYNDFAVRACALALRREPKLNASVVEHEIHYHERVNVGVAVASGDALVVPTVFDADQKPVAEISADIATLAGKVKDGTIAFAELADQTFTVSNLGMYGIRRFTAIISQPQVGILALGGVHDVLALADDGRPVPSSRMAAVLTADHRVVYGADAARFLVALKELLETPAALLEVD